MTRAGILDAIDTALGTVTTPEFPVIVRGEPLSIPTTPTVSFWLTQHEEDFETLADASVTVEFTIRCYWRMQSTPTIKENLELEVFDAINNIKQALRSNSNLSGNCDDSRPGFAATGYVDMSGMTFKTADIPFFVYLYGANTITV